MSEKKPRKNKPGAGRPVEWTSEKLKVLGEELIAYCLRPDVWHVSEFELLEKKQCSGWLNQIATRQPEFHSFLKGAKEILAQKMVKTAMDGGGNNWVIGKFVPMYMKDVDDHEEGKKDKQLERDLKKEKYKYELGAAKDEEAEAKIDTFDKSAQLAYENKKLRDEIAKLKGE